MGMYPSADLFFGVDLGEEIETEDGVCIEYEELDRLLGEENNDLSFGMYSSWDSFWLGFHIGNFGEESCEEINMQKVVDLNLDSARRDIENFLKKHKIKCESKTAFRCESKIAFRIAVSYG